MKYHYLKVDDGNYSILSSNDSNKDSVKWLATVADVVAAKHIVSSLNALEEGSCIKDKECIEESEYSFFPTHENIDFFIKKVKKINNVFVKINNKIHDGSWINHDEIMHLFLLQSLPDWANPTEQTTEQHLGFFTANDVISVIKTLIKDSPLHQVKTKDFLKELMNYVNQKS